MEEALLGAPEAAHAEDGDFGALGGDVEGRSEDVVCVRQGHRGGAPGEGLVGSRRGRAKRVPTKGRATRATTASASARRVHWVEGLIGLLDELRRGGGGGYQGGGLAWVTARARPRVRGVWVRPGGLA